MNTVLSLCAVLLFFPSAITAAQPGGKQMNIGIKIGNHLITGVLHDSPAARDFASRLPLTLRLKDYAGTEKIADLPGGKLDMQDAPVGMDPALGDITYYSPWGNLAIFYRNFGYASGLIPLGKITSGMEHLSALRETVTVLIYRIEEKKAIRSWLP